MNWEQRLEDARARRQVVLEQKDRTARAAKAAAQRIPEVAETPKKAGSVQEIPRARPAGTNARVLEAALRQRDPVQPAVVLPPDATAPRANENEAPEINDIREFHAETVDIAMSDAPLRRRSRTGIRLSLAGLAAIVSFGIGIIASPTIVSRFQRQVAISPTNLVPPGVPRQPSAAAVLENQGPSLASPIGPDNIGFLTRGAPLPPELTAFQPAPPVVGPAAVNSFEIKVAESDTPQALESSISESEIFARFAAVRPVPRAPKVNVLVLQDVAPISLSAIRGPKAPRFQGRSVEGASSVQVAALAISRLDTLRPEFSALTDVAIDASPIALLSPGPQIVTAPGSRVLVALKIPNGFPPLPELSIARRPPIAAPATLAPLIEDASVSANIATPPAKSEPTRQLTGIAEIRSYLVHVQSHSSLGDGQLAEFESIIADTGLPIGKINRVGYKISSSHIRYYHRRDATAAAALAERIGARARDFTSYRPSPAIGTLEVFLSGSTSTQRTATQSGTQQRRLDRELIELRNRLIQRLQRGDHL